MICCTVLNSKCLWKEWKRTNPFFPDTVKSLKQGQIVQKTSTIIVTVIAVFTTFSLLLLHPLNALLKLFITQLLLKSAEKCKVVFRELRKRRGTVNANACVQQIIDKVPAGAVWDDLELRWEVGLQAPLQTEKWEVILSKDCNLEFEILPLKLLFALHWPPAGREKEFKIHE